MILLSFVQAFAQTGHYYSSDLFSSSLISSLCQDRDGSVWIATDYGLNRFDGYHFQTFLHNPADNTSLSVNTVVSTFCDRDGRLWVGTNRGLDRFDAAHETFIHYQFPDGLQPRVTSIVQRNDGSILAGTAGYGAFVVDKDNSMKQYALENADHYFSRIYEDSKGRLWKSGFDDVIYMCVGDKVKAFQSEMGNPQGFVEMGDALIIACLHGFMSFHNNVMSVADIDMSAVAGKDVIFSSVVADKDYVYVGTRGQGIYRVSKTHPRKLERADFNVSGVDLRTAKISSMMFDHKKNLWVGCHRKGLLMVPQKPVHFANWNFDNQGIRLGSTISSVCEGDNGIVWCTVQGVGVYGFNRQGQVVAHPSAPNAVEFIFRDLQHRYWVGTDDGLFAYDPTTGRSQLKVNFDCDKFNDMTSDESGNIYISTFSRGFCVYHPETGELRNHNFYEEDEGRGRLCNNWIMGMSSDRQGNIWLATSSGVSCYDPRKDSFRSLGWNSQLDGIICFDVCELRSGELADGRQLSGCVVIGTEEGLYLYDKLSKKVELFPGSELLRDKAVSYIVQSNDGDVWCSTSQGIWQYQQSSHSFIGYVAGNGLMKREYLYGVGMHNDDDRIFFGHNDGLTVFTPKDVKATTTELDTLRLTAFRVGDQYVCSNTVINDEEVTDRSISQSDYFTLSYLDHTVMLAFSTYDFESAMNMVLEYRLNDGNWIRNPEGQNSFTLGHLQPGSYRIEVRAQYGDKYTPVKVLMVIIRSPWYKSLFAYFVYFIVLAALALYVLRTYRRRANEQLNEEKMKFLINATHDIRSPLTIILSALKKLESSPAVDTIEHNSQRILNLVNQILDVRKIDKQQMQLHCQQTDIVAFVKGICRMFEFNAQERNIKFSFVHEGLDHLNVWIDRSQFDKVVTNLISNAFKYNYDGGEVTIRLASIGDKEDQNIEKTDITANLTSKLLNTPTPKLLLQVIDNGVGLDSESLKHIFERFYQGSNSRRMHIDGTGIGLNLCKMIVDMHHGTIEAHNNPSGKGSIFTVVLLLGNAHLQPNEIDTTLPVSLGATVKGSGSAGSQRRRVLLVDDDLEIAHYISTELGHYYKFGICSNGKEGLKELLTNDYDVVISDVMMPEMDGFTMLRMIKTNLNISDIPVIMLTSKADVGNRLEGLERGADAFLAKPFDMRELRMNIENLIHNRQRLKGKYSGAQLQSDKVDQPEVKGNDEQLMERIMKAINANLSNSDFNVDMMTKEVGISRAQLHRKMKEMTGISTSEFIRNIRLEQAARLLREQKVNVTQVAYAVGFSNLAHFSTIFRKHFGVAPSDFAEREAE
jgi:signal transduction histidine kinase/ligand-binding sensor domain-containing protein/DNA-binding response OmpR family regulator